MPTLTTAAVRAGKDADIPLGWIKFEDGPACRWVMRDLGSDRRAASIRRFCDQALAIEW
jgi:hypothetical protein